VPIAALGAALIALGLLWQQYGEQVTTTMEQLGFIIVWALNQAATKVAEWVAAVGTSFSQLWTIIIYYLNEASSTITTFFTDGLAQWRANWEMFSGIVGGVWDSITSKISGAVSSVKGWIDSVVNKLNSITLPGWLVGHSPPPLANWFSDIGEAMDDAAKAKLPQLNAMVGVAHSFAPAAAASSSTSTRR